MLARAYFHNNISTHILGEKYEYEARLMQSINQLINGERGLEQIDITTVEINYVCQKYKQAIRNSLMTASDDDAKEYSLILVNIYEFLAQTFPEEFYNSLDEAATTCMLIYGERSYQIYEDIISRYNYFPEIKYEVVELYRGDAEELECLREQITADALTRGERNEQSEREQEVIDTQETSSQDSQTVNNADTDTTTNLIGDEPDYEDSADSQ